MSKKKVVKLIECEDCQATGLVLPENNKQYSSQATEMCPSCDGSGKKEDK